MPFLSLLLLLSGIASAQDRPQFDWQGEVQDVILLRLHGDRLTFRLRARPSLASNIVSTIRYRMSAKTRGSKFAKDAASWTSWTSRASKTNTRSQFRSKTGSPAVHFIRSPVMLPIKPSKNVPVARASWSGPVAWMKKRGPRATTRCAIANSGGHRYTISVYILEPFPNA